MVYWRELNLFRRWLFLLGLAGLLIAQINQPFPQVAWLHHSPTLLFVLSIPFLAHWVRLSDRGLLCIFLFFALHTVAARYTYSSTPYDAWFAAAFGQELNPLMGWERNNFDRLVHLAFGALFVLPAYEIARHHTQVSHRFALYIALEFILAVSALYEVFEWFLSVVMAPENAQAYNGQQGDFWDAQKDMALAFTGALIAACVIWYRSKAREIDTHA